MKQVRSIKWGRAGFLCACCSALVVTILSAWGAGAGAGMTVEEALKQVTAGCPQGYPDSVMPVPTEEFLRSSSEAVLMGMLGSWNPVIRRAVADELGRRGDKVVPALKRAAEADHWQLRQGALAALINVVKYQTQNWQTLYPETTQFDEARDKIAAKHSDLVKLFIEGTRDPDRSVRHTALGGIQALAPQTTEAVTAVLDLCGDEDVYTAQGAMATLGKTLDISVVDREVVIPAFKAAMRTPMPRGKAFIVGLIAKMDESDQRELVPELLYHLDWQPDRDTMFGAGGQAESVQILTKLKVNELVPRIPALIKKTMRGPGLFEPCMESVLAFGKDARVIVPELRAYERELEDSLATANSRSKPGIEKKLARVREVVKTIEDL